MEVDNFDGGHILKKNLQKCNMQKKDLTATSINLSGQ